MASLQENDVLLSYYHTPIVEVKHPAVFNAGLKLLIKREDLNHPLVSGNKWWKLKYNLQQTLEDRHDTILTFGGAYSNHIYATAAAAKAINLKSIGIIRGEETLPLNPTLAFAADCGMTLRYVSRGAYRTKDSASFHHRLQQMFGDFYLIPEGGTNELALKGCEEFGRLIDSVPADYVCLPAGTGGTMGGLLRVALPGKKVIGFCVLKNGEFLREQVTQYSRRSNNSWDVQTKYAYGGYGKRHPEVSDFIKTFLETTNIPLDFVYTGKMMCALFDLIERGFFEQGKTILAIHTGGLQGHSQG